MTANLQSRSASISTPINVENQPVALFKASAAKNNNSLRSASIGSHFFNKDTSNFFNDAANTTSNSDDLAQDSSNSSNGPLPEDASQNVAATSGDLDIVGALGNLDLDGDFELPKDSSKPADSIGDSVTIESNDTPKPATPFNQQPQFFYAAAGMQSSGVPGPMGGLPADNTSASNYYQQFYPPQGSLTPNPSTAGFASNSFGPTSTPSTTWTNNFVPSSAPPFAYAGNAKPNATDLSLSVKPFDLPEDQKENSTAAASDKTSVNGTGMSGAIPGPGIPHNIPNLHIPFSTPPPPVFGGVSDSQMQFNSGQPGQGLYGGASFPSDPTGASTGDASTGAPISGDVNGPEGSGAIGGPMMGQPFPMRAFSMNGTPNPVHMHPLGLGPEGAKSNGFFSENMNMMPPPMSMAPPPAQVGSPNMWNQHPLMNDPRHNNIPGQHGFDGRIGTPVGQHMGGPQFNGPMINNRFNSGHHHHHSHHNHSGGRQRNSSNNNNHYGLNNGMNVHRKMHNNHRRKGDDASKYANAKLEDFTGEFYSLCKDQHGCRFLQRQLDLGREAATSNDPNVLTNDIAATMIFNEIYLKIIELMLDPFGNYLIQKLFENVSTDQRIILVKNAAPEFIRIALDPHGTRALQKLVECISTDEESHVIIESLSPHIVSLSRDLNGNHVVQKCLQKLKSEDNQFIFDTASMHCNEIATHRHGCCVLQRCLDHGNSEQRQQLSLKVAENATNLSLDPFGNYVVQYVLSRGDDGSIKIILDHIKSNVISLSLHKFGSNVIEKSLRISKLTDSLISVLLLNKDRFSEMLNDAFGNYVLQTSLDVASKEDLAKLSVALQPLLPNIKNTPHGRRIMTKIQSIV